MANKTWYTVKMKLKVVLETEQACLVKVNGLPKFRGWVVWLPKGCIQDRYTILLHKSMTLTLFVQTNHKDEVRQEHELTAEDFFNLFED